MQLVSTETKERTVNIPVPSFWKDAKHEDYIAVINEQTAISLFQLNDTTIIRHNPPKSNTNEIVKAVENWNPITEGEFMSTYSAALKSISLEPVLK